MAIVGYCELFMPASLLGLVRRELRCRRRSLVDRRFCFVEQLSQFKTAHYCAFVHSSPWRPLASKEGLPGSVLSGRRVCTALL